MFAVTVSKRVQEIHQVIHLLVGKFDTEALIIEHNYIVERGGGAIVEIGCARSQPTQCGNLDLADVGAVSGNEGATWVGDGELLLCQGPGHALQHKDGQSGNVESGGCMLPGVGDANILRSLHRTIAYIWRVVAGATGAGYDFLIEGVVEPRHASDEDGLGIEDRFAARDRLAAEPLIFVAGGAFPGVIDIEDVWIERFVAWIHRQRIVDPDEEFRELRGEGFRASRCAVAVEIVRTDVKALRREDSALEADDLFRLRF